MVFFEVVDVLDEVFAPVIGFHQLPRIHPYRVARTGLHAVTAVNAPQQIDREFLRIFLFVRSFPLGRLDVNAVGGADRLTEHAGGATDAFVFPKHQTMFRSMNRRDWFFLLRPLHRHHFVPEKHVLDQMAERNHHPLDDLDDVEPLEEGKLLFLKKDGHLNLFPNLVGGEKSINNCRGGPLSA